MFTVPLSFAAHEMAQRHQKQQSQPLKAKQVYLNTLAVYSVDFYLQCLGFETDSAKSDCYDPLISKFMDVADLFVPQIGKLECRPTLPEDQSCQIPPDVWSDRVGYIAVQLSQTLKQATLVGFSPTAMAEIPFSQLTSLSQLPQYLQEIRQSAVVPAPVSKLTLSTGKAAISLSRWLENTFETGWQSIEDVLGINRQMVFVRDAAQVQASVRRAKLIDVGMQLGEKAVAMPIAVTLNEDKTVKVLVQVHPERGQAYLPPNLKLVMLSDQGEPLQEVYARGQDNYIQLRQFKGQTGDRFGIQVVLGDIIVTEEFTL